MDARKGEKCSPSFDHQLSRDENMAEVEQTDTGSNASDCSERKRKRSSDGECSEKSQEVGPSGGGGIEEAMRNEEEENKNAEINPLTIEIQMIKWKKQQLQINHKTMKLNLKKEMEEEMAKLRRFYEKVEEINYQIFDSKTNLKKEMEEEMAKVRWLFVKKVEEEKIKIQQELVYLVCAHQKLIWNQALADQWSTSASSSSQVPQPTTQLGPLPCVPQQICRAPAPTGSAQAGGHSGSVLRPHIQNPNLTLWRPMTHLVRSRPHPSATPPATSTPAPVVPTSSQTPLWHADKAITAAPLAPAPHFASSRPRSSVIPATSTPGATTSYSAPLLPRPTIAPCVVLWAPAPHLRPRLTVNPGTTNPFPGPYPSTIPGTYNRSRYGASSSRADGTASGTGRLAVNEDGVICLYDDNWDKIN